MDNYNIFICIYIYIYTSADQTFWYFGDGHKLSLVRLSCYKVVSQRIDEYKCIPLSVITLRALQLDILCDAREAAGCVVHDRALLNCTTTLL